MATLLDVARHADVSTQTVSRVVNNDPRVRPRTRRLVLQSIEALGYVPNGAARSLRRARSNTLGFEIPDLTNLVYQEVIAGVEEIVRGRGYSLLLCDSRGDPRIQAENLKRLYERRVEGLLLYPVSETCPELELFIRAQIPVISLGGSGPSLGVPRMPLDQRAGLRDGLRYLLKLGHERLALITTVYFPYRARALEYEELALELGLTPDPSLVVLVASAEECTGTIKAILARPDRPSAIISGSLTLSPFILQAIRSVGLQVPKDVSFLTMGDSPWAAVCAPPLTVVRHDLISRGRLAAEYMFSRLSGATGDGLLREIRSELLIRDSCAPPTI